MMTFFEYLLERKETSLEKTRDEHMGAGNFLCHRQELFLGQELSLRGDSVTRQPDHRQANKTNTAAKRLARLTNQLEGTFPEPGLMRQEASAPSAPSVTDATDTTDHVKDIYHFE